MVFSRFQWRVGRGQQAERRGQGIRRVIQRVGHQNGDGHRVVAEQLPV